MTYAVKELAFVITSMWLRMGSSGNEFARLDRAKYVNIRVDEIDVGGPIGDFARKVLRKDVVMPSSSDSAARAERVVLRRASHGDSRKSGRRR